MINDLCRGHRQKGAGTVISDRKAIETKDGVVLKSHERFPSVLLNEYCTREKRPMPIYMRVHDKEDASERDFEEIDYSNYNSSTSTDEKFRFKLLLKDKKNSKDDLYFCPIQSSSSERLAKDFSALLALFHFQVSSCCCFFFYILIDIIH